MQTFDVRVYDGFDSEWFDCIEGVSLTREQADQLWLERTDGGTRATTFDDIDYYAIFEHGTIRRVPNPQPAD